VGFIILLGTDFLIDKKKLNYLLSAWNRIILEKIIVSQMIINGNRCFMTSPKEPATCPYTTLSAILEHLLYIILVSTPSSCKLFLFFKFDHQNLEWISDVPRTCLVSSFLVWSVEWYLMRNINHEASYYASLSILLLPPPLSLKCVLQHHRLKHFFSVCERPSLGPYKTLIITRTVVGIFSSTFMLMTGGQNIQDRAIPDISCIWSAANLFIHEIWL
jgi:hypothetical protein